MKKMLSAAAFLFLLFAIPSHAQETTVSLAAPATPCVNAGVYPINCTFTVPCTDALFPGNCTNGTQAVRIYYLPNGNATQCTVLIPSLDVGVPCTSMTPTIPQGQYFPSALTITFQGGELWDNDLQRYVPVTGTATMTLTYTKHPVSWRRVVWTATATLVSMQYTY
jgi:hypothetical protein